LGSRYTTAAELHHLKPAILGVGMTGVGVIKPNSDNITSILTKTSLKAVHLRTSLSIPNYAAENGL
jgi:hypothetical protein